ncbi:MAG: hypothetical protein AB7I38_04030 [Dehalococcoidia bacterium]
MPDGTDADSTDVATIEELVERLRALTERYASEGSRPRSTFPVIATVSAMKSSSVGCRCS